MQEIRFHGRGGQGTVIASKLLAVATAYEGNWVQAFPEFGVERRGAPVAAFLRINRSQIFERYRIYKPHHIVVLDPSIMHAVNVTEGLRTDGWIIINSRKNPDELSIHDDYKIATVDAGGIATQHRLGSATAPIVNTAILGAVVRILGPCSLESLVKAIREEAPLKKEENVAAAVESYERVRELEYALP